MQHNTLIQTFGQTVWVGFTGLLSLAALWLGLFWIFAPAAIASPIQPETSLIAYSSKCLSNQSSLSEFESDTSCESPADEGVSVLVASESQEPVQEMLDLQAVDAIKTQTEKALQLVEINAKQVFVQAKEAAEKASSKAEDAFDEFIVWLKSFSS